jgi:hypothetical protein
VNSDDIDEADDPGKPAEPGQPKVYKTLDDQIEVGDIVRDREGRLMKRAHWGWDYSADAIE